ncbi:MAG: hypothetical protein M3143_06995 [Actinomycetota bacterium]|nr:hypothetical protein [Actinomycetota bacterium]
MPACAVAGFTVLVAPLAVPSDLFGLDALLLVAGTLITPRSTAHSVRLSWSRPAVTEALGWVITAVTLGLALGQSASGWLIEHAGVRGPSWLPRSPA